MTSRYPRTPSCSAAHDDSLANNKIAPLLARQMNRLCGQVHPDIDAAARRLLADTTLDLLRSVVTEAGTDRSLRQDVLQYSLGARIEHHILAHLGDPELSPESIAKAHFISLRQLYYVCSRAENLSEWIMERRLDAAHRLLTATSHPNVSAIARRCGFANSAHFSRRYRLRFGTTPTAARSRQDI